jgi:hypothetical protein
MSLDHDTDRGMPGSILRYEAEASYAAHIYAMNMLAAQRSEFRAKSIAAPMAECFEYECDYCGRKAFTRPLNCVGCGAPA